MNFEASPRSREFLERVQQFIVDHIEPIEAQYWREVHDANPTGDWTKWTIHPTVEKLKAKAKAQGLWNLFMPDPKLGAGLSTLRTFRPAGMTNLTVTTPASAMEGSAPLSGTSTIKRNGSTIFRSAVRRCMRSASTQSATRTCWRSSRRSG